VRVRVIVNPRAGVAARAALDEVRRGRPSWRDLDVRLTAGPEDAAALAEQAARSGVELVVAVGGDGTANEAARGLLGSSVPLGIVPAGSGNGLARALGIPMRPDRALAALESSVVRQMDVGFVNGQPFLNVAGTGFDAAVGWAFHRAGRGGARRGFTSYLRQSLALVRTYRASRLLLELGAARIELRPFVVAFANGPQYGAGAIVNPGARLDDGRFEVVCLDDGPVAETLWLALRLFLGGLERSRRYRRWSVRRAAVQAEPGVTYHRDGEPEAAAPTLVVTLAPRALRVLVPRRTAEDRAGPFTASPEGATDPAVTPRGSFEPAPEQPGS
jgi:diacylglycerol kinase (ATP)